MWLPRPAQFPTTTFPTRSLGLWAKPEPPVAKQLGRTRPPRSSHLPAGLRKLNRRSQSQEEAVACASLRPALSLAPGAGPPDPHWPGQARVPVHRPRRPLRRRWKPCSCLIKDARHRPCALVFLSLPPSQGEHREHGLSPVAVDLELNEVMESRVPASQNLQSHWLHLSTSMY